MQESTSETSKVVNMGIVLPGLYATCSLPLKSTRVSFLKLQISAQGQQSGFYIVKEDDEDTYTTSKQIVLKPGKVHEISLIFTSKVVLTSTNFYGDLYISQKNSVTTIRLVCRVEIPKISSLKMLEHVQTKEKLIRIMINKAVTNQARIMLVNNEDYKLELRPGLLFESKISDRENPFILNVSPEPIVAERQFTIFVNISTNIGFKKEFKGIKKCVFRNVLTLRTESAIIWCLPIEIIVIYVKQPQIKQIE